MSKPWMMPDSKATNKTNVGYLFKNVNPSPDTGQGSNKQQLRQSLFTSENEARIGGGCLCRNTIPNENIVCCDIFAQREDFIMKLVARPCDT